MMLSLTLMLAALQTNRERPIVPLTAPIYCVTAPGEYTLLSRTNLGRLEGAFQRQFGFKPHLTQSGPTTGTLAFRSPDGAESISYDVEPHTGESGVGLALVRMHARFTEQSEDPIGEEMCQNTWGIVNTQ